MSTEIILLDIDPRGVATMTLNRPEVHNAFNDDLIARITETVDAVEADPAVRVVKIAGNGKSYSAGADLNWMRRMADYSREENREDALKVARMFNRLATLRCPTVAVVHGNAFGGGVGLIAACDIAVAADDARFSLSEVKLGLIPATISPYVVDAVGPRQARRLFLTAERFDARQAMAFGLVHAVSPGDRLDETVDVFVSQLLENGPESLAASKALVSAVANRPIDEAVMVDTAERIAERRASDEGREGVAAFLGKRPPGWIRA